MLYLIAGYSVCYLIAFSLLSRRWCSPHDDWTENTVMGGFFLAVVISLLAPMVLVAFVVRAFPDHTARRLAEEARHLRQREQELGIKHADD